MKPVDELRKLLDTRMHGNPDSYYYVTLWEDEVKIICANMEESIRFIREDCTDEELYWLGEIYNDIMDKTRHKAFLQALRERAQRVENPEWKKDILIDIRDAAEYIDE